MTLGQFTKYSYASYEKREHSAHGERPIRLELWRLAAAADVREGTGSTREDLSEEHK